MSAFTPEKLADIHAASFTTPRPWSSDDFAGLLAMPGVFLITGAGPGFALGRAIAGEAELLTLAVAPNARGRGHGGKILAAFEAKARTQTAQIAFLEVAADNLRAIALYQRAGYRESGLRKGYYTTPEGTKIDAVLFEKPL